jgi:hypothetical protein
MASSPLDVTLWMQAKIDADGTLYQEVAVYEIIDRFGEDFAYINSNGNCAIAKPVLKEFKRLTGDYVIWIRGERYWRKREDGDAEGRQQEF